MCEPKDATAGGVPRKGPGLHYKPFGASGRSITAFFLRNLRTVLAHFFQNPPSIESWASGSYERCVQGVYKGCTREAQGMLTLEKVVQPSCIRCAPLVHDAKSRQWACDDKCLAGAGLANPGGVLSLEVALAV